LPFGVPNVEVFHGFSKFSNPVMAWPVLGAQAVCVPPVEQIGVLEGA
jgi:hypothetical protein